jgi:hypothetical protein
LQEFDRDTASVAEFCRRAGVSVASFYQWRRRLSAVVPAEGSTPRVPATAMNFLPVEITPPRGSMVEVLLPNGARVLVPSSEREAICAVIEAAASIQPEARAC